MPDRETLTEILKARISIHFKISFAEFMAEALYHPDLGYYSSERTRIGKAGDYFTSPIVHPAFGGLICKELQEMWQITGWEEFSIVEMGGGNGTLCHDILKYAKDRHPSFYRVLKYIIIEESAYMRKIQRVRLINSGFSDETSMSQRLTNNDGNPLPFKGRDRPVLREVEGVGMGLFSDEAKIRWADASDPMFLTGVTGCFLSNELVDAFPVHIVEKKGGGLKELFVGLQNDAFVEILDPPSSPEIEKYLDRIGIELEEGQRAEVNLRAVEWMRWVAGALKKGFVITIDYGYHAEELYAADRSSGTLLCYHRHRVVEDPFINIGEQDMTSHVDFTTLMLIGEESGLKSAGFTDQMHFLFGLGIGEMIEAVGSNTPAESDALKERLLIKNLIMPGRMGNVFKVLIQYKGFADKPALSGLRKNPFT